MVPSELTPAILASHAAVTEAELFYWARNSEVCYLPTDRRKTGKGKERDIDPPKPLPKAVFRRLHRFWQKRFRPHRVAHGGVCGRSCFTSARRHLGRKYIEARDVSDCYPSIKTEQLRLALLARGFRSDTAWLLSRLFTVHGRIPQGSPLSSDALNIYMASADDAIASSCGRERMSVSRVYDDLVISHDRRDLKGVPGKLLERHIEDLGLKVNERKRRKTGLQANSGPQIIHGIVVNSKRGTRINPQHSKRALDAAESYRRSARAVSSDTLEAVVAKREVAFGWMHHCRQAEHSPAKEVRRLLDAGDRLVARKLSGAGLAAHRKKWWVHSRRGNPRRLAALWRRRLDATRV